jgi:digalactosyldiacylglycerol synthase
MPNSSKDTNKPWTTQALSLDWTKMTTMNSRNGKEISEQFRTAWERTIQDAKAKFISTTDTSDGNGGDGNNSNSNSNKRWMNGIQNAVDMNQQQANALLARAISMESIRELAKKVNKPINEGLLKVGDSQFMEKFKRQAQGGGDQAQRGLRRSDSKPDDLNVDANRNHNHQNNNSNGLFKTRGSSNGLGSEGYGGLRRTSSLASQHDDDGITPATPRSSSSPFSSSQDLSEIFEKNVMPKVKDITENITKNLQPPEGWDVFKAVNSSKKKHQSSNSNNNNSQSSGKKQQRSKGVGGGFFSRRSSQESLSATPPAVSDNEDEIDDIREKFGKLNALQTTKQKIFQSSSEALDTLKQKFSSSPSGSPASPTRQQYHHGGGEIKTTTNSNSNSASEEEEEQQQQQHQKFSMTAVAANDSSGKKKTLTTTAVAVDVSTQTDESKQQQSYTTKTTRRSIKEPGRQVAIVTTATLPWMTGTAVNPLLRAAYLARRGLHDVTLVVPFIPVDEQKMLHPNSIFDSPEEQEKYVRSWVKERCGFDVPNLKMNFYPGRYATDKMSIIPVGDVSSHIKNSNDVAILEEPEHLNWFHSGPRWSDSFEHVVGIIHTNYLDYVRLEEHGGVKEKALNFVNSVVSRVHCHKVIKLSNAVQEFPRSCTMNVHGVSPVFLDVGASKAAAKRVQLMGKEDLTDFSPLPLLTNAEPQFASITTKNKQQQKRSINNNKRQQNITHATDEANDDVVDKSVFTKGAYFLGKVVWGKGYHELLDCVEKHNSNSEYGSSCPISMDVYGNGEDLESVSKAAADKNLPLNFKGRLDHANPEVHDYKIFLNPSLSDVVATTTAEALAMGKFVVCAKHPSNEFFSSFPNCLTYGNQEEFSECMKKAFATEPKPLSADDAYRLSWEAATDRFLDAAELGPEHEKDIDAPLSKISETVAASAFYALNNNERIRQAMGAGTGTLKPPDTVDANWKPEKWEAAGLCSKNVTSK